MYFSRIGLSIDHVRIQQPFHRRGKADESTFIRKHLCQAQMKPAVPEAQQEGAGALRRKNQGNTSPANQDTACKSRVGSLLQPDASPQISEISQCCNWQPLLPRQQYVLLSGMKKKKILIFFDGEVTVNSMKLFIPSQRTEYFWEVCRAPRPLWAFRILYFAL